MEAAQKTLSVREAPAPIAAAAPTRDFLAALDEAGLLLQYAASTGRLPLAGTDAAQATQNTIRDVVNAQEAARCGRVPPQTVTTFWMAYARLAAILAPVTAASLLASRQLSLAGMKLRAAALVSAVILFSIFLFMSNATLSDTSDLIDQQNQASLQLWSDIQLLADETAAQPQTAQAHGNQAALVTERAFTDVVEFARRNAWLLQSASRLNYWFTPPWLQLSIDQVKFDGTGKDGLDHLNVPPQTSGADQVRTEAINQIKAFQNIRDYALGLFKIDTLIYTSLSTYFLPTVYALLGAFLNGFRVYSRLIRRMEFRPSAAHSARYFIAAIAGLVIGLFGSLMPKNLALSPLAFAFLAGYAVEAFFSRLDGLIRRIKDGAEESARPTVDANGTGD